MRRFGMIEIALLSAMTVFMVLNSITSAGSILNTCASSRPCALDLVIYATGGAPTIDKILPVAIAIYFLFMMRYMFKYKYITQCYSRKRFITKIMGNVMAVCVLLVIMSMAINFLVGCLRFGVVCNYDSPSSLFRDKLNTNGILVEQYSVFGILAGSAVINIVKLCVRAMVAVLFYIITDSGVLAIIAMLGLIKAVGFRMIDYTYLLRGSFYAKEFVTAAIALLLVLLLLLICTQKKNFCKA